MKPLQFDMQSSKEFHEILKQKVKQYFESRKKSDKGNWSLYLKTVILFVAWLGAYALILFAATWIREVILGYIFFWVVGWLIGFNVMHDGGHGGYSKKKRVNELMGYSMNLLGSDLFFWKMQHNVLHHTYTNINQYDDDIDSWPVFRFHPDQEKKRFHKYQHLYFLPLYGIGTIALMFYGDFRRYFRKQVGSLWFKSMKRRQHVTFWLTKLFMISIYFVIPAFFIGRRQALVGMLCMFFIMSIIINTIFQLAHVLEKTDMKSASLDYKIDAHWAIHQLQTTANFAMNNKVWTWLLGWLNFQVEHHLFPYISHVHYPKIASIVQSVCHQFAIPYHTYPSVMSAFISHVKHIKQLWTEK
jgi:linoleoyl-CoA desaturase